GRRAGHDLHAPQGIGRRNAGEHGPDDLKPEPQDKKPVDEDASACTLARMSHGQHSKEACRLPWLTPVKPCERLLAPASPRNRSGEDLYFRRRYADRLKNFAA